MVTDQLIAKKVEDILKNHYQEIKMIESQIKAEQETLKADLEDIRSRAYPATRYDLPMGSGQLNTQPDRKMMKIMDAIIRREEQSTRAIANLEERKRQIESIYHHVLSLDARSKCTLVALYYPVKTYDDAADILGIDVSTVTRRRKLAIERLVNRVKKHRSDV